MKLAILLAIILLPTMIFSVEVILDQTMKNQLLAAHNYYRTIPIPMSLTPITPLVWSDTLAGIWKRNADSCSDPPVHYADRGAGYSVAIGENIYYRTANITDYASPVAAWYSEYTLWGPPYTLLAGCSTGSGCGHYTQVVWNTTTAVGCSYYQCPGTSWVWRLVCNYQTSGNFLNTKPYTEQPACTRLTSCPAGYNCGTASDGCGGSISCGSCPTGTSQCTNNVCRSCVNPNACSGRSCGTVDNGCGAGTTVSCGVCSGSLGCNTQTGQCLPCTPKTCAVGDCRTGLDNGCGGTLDCSSNCGSCQTCNLGTCKAIACCPSCPANQTCQSGACACISGFQRDSRTGGCSAIPSAPVNWDAVLDASAPASDWTTLYDGSYTLTKTGLHTLRWVKSNSSSYASLIKTGFSAEIYSQASSSSAIALRYNQGSGRSNDYIMWRVKLDSSAKATLEFVWRYFGVEYVRKSYSIQWPINTWNKLQMTITTVAPNIQFYITVNGNSPIPSTYLFSASSAYPQLGYALISTNQANAKFRSITIYTTTSLRLTASQCLNQAAWTSLVQKALGAVSVVVRTVSDDNAYCGVNKRQAEAVGNIVVLDITSIEEATSEALASKLIQLAETGQLSSEVQVTSIEIVPYDPQGTSQLTQGELIPPPEEEVPISPPEDTVPISPGDVVPATPTGGDGLGTGAIVGIAIGSAVGGILIISGIVAAVVVAVILFKRRKVKSTIETGNTTTSDLESNTQEEPEKPKRRNRGVDIYDFDPAKHKSLTGRLPSGYTDVVASIDPKSGGMSPDQSS